jgi:hypothetical protein
MKKREAMVRFLDVAQVGTPPADWSVEGNLMKPSSAGAAGTSTL